MSSEENYDVVVVGGGIAGQEAALSLAAMDKQVLLVEKGLSVGGKMIQLSKVFPTLDCAACITTPKMSETARHPNITLALGSTISNINRNGKFTALVTTAPRYVKKADCTGCQECEAACPEVRLDNYNENLVGRKVAYIPFSLANPRIATIDRAGTSAPCIAACPGGVKAYGFVSLARNGQFDEAMELHLEDNPLPGSLGRACYAPCEGQCSRHLAEGPVDMRRIKRHFSEKYYDKNALPHERKKKAATGKKVAIVGSGPAGLTAAYFLAQNGHEVTIHEAQKEAGGMLKMTLPQYRLPNAIVDRDILNITSLGVKIETGSRIEDVAALKARGYDAVVVAVGTHESTRLKVPGSELPGIIDCIEFLRESKIGTKVDLSGKRVMVVGGGNTAMDASRTALRLGAASVTIVYRRGRDEMPAWPVEIAETEEEGVKFEFLRNPVSFSGATGAAGGKGVTATAGGEGVTSVRLVKMELGAPDSSGRRSTTEIIGSEYDLPIDYVIEAIGLKPSTTPFQGKLELNKNGTVKADATTLQTATPWLFAAGDSQSGSTTIIEAAGQGKRAAFYLDRFLRGLEVGAAEFGDKLPAADAERIVREKAFPAPVIPQKFRDGHERVKDWEEVEKTFTDEEATKAASRCLDCSNCRECHQCVSACPADAIDFSMKEQKREIKADALVLATGYDLFDPTERPHYNFGHPNVITSMQMDRLIAPTRPFNNLLRPGDGKVPANIAYVLCAGSRDSSLSNFKTCGTSPADNPACSQICCMYSIKQAQLLMGALPMADITIYYIDIRAFGKGYEEFYQQSRGMGVNFVKGKVARINGDPKNPQDAILIVEDIERGILKEAKHDLVVLSTGIRPVNEIVKAFASDRPALDEHSFIKVPDPMFSPGQTTVEGVFAAGTATAAMDIPDSILSAGAAAAGAASYIARRKAGA
ncbi:MAG TPA: FAD-dependent oxidoreductase [Rectinemataceae bacterium]|nr:FAD-dependent oxidoreductase [Rectinemataceae bacterium]